LYSKTVLLIRTEMKMLFNQFRNTISNPSMLTFYGTSLVGAYFVSNILSTLIGFAPMFTGISSIFQTNLELSVMYTSFAFITALAVVGGFFGIGRADVLVQTDEHIIMPAPIQPYQLFITRYFRRFVRRLVYVMVSLVVLLPVISSGNLMFSDVLLSVSAILLFFEANYFIGGIASHIQRKISRSANRGLRYGILFLMILLVLIPSIPLLIYNPVFQFFVPSTSTVSTIIALTGIQSIGVDPLLSFGGLLLTFLILGLILSILFNFQDYEIYSTNRDIMHEKSGFRSLVRGQIDFSNTRFRDPMIWIMLKDFWTRMRSPFQFWKYVYILVGTISVLLLNLIQPVGIDPIRVPGEFNYAAIPAFLIMLLLLSQMTSVTSLLSFVDERENIYLLKVSPFSSKDIVLGKYLLSLIESGLAAIPIFGILVFFLRVDNSIILLTIGIPFLLIFSATGTMFGAYIPVFTNDPRTPPVPLAFAFPTLNLIIGAAIIYLLTVTKAGILFTIMLPVITLSLVIVFLMLSIIALRSYL